MNGIRRWWRALMHGKERDAETDARLTRLEAGSRLVRMKTTKNLKQANWLKANARQLRSNPVEDAYLRARRDHA